MIVAILTLAVLAILALMGQQALIIWVVMGIVSVLIVRHYVADYNHKSEARKNSEPPTQ